MFVDASALLAILLMEPEANEFSDVIAAGTERVTSPIAIYETVTAILRVRGMGRVAAEQEVDAALRDAGIVVMPIDGAIGRTALEAFERYGKGRGHPAQLNMGDCFAYACAKVRGVPLLYKGDDFARTDLA